MKRSILMPVLAALAAGCGSDVVKPPGPFTLTMGTGDAQAGAAGSALTSPFTVGVADAVGPVAGVTVRWKVLSGGGSVPASTMTGPDGVAEAVYTLGTTAGSKLVSATVDGATDTVRFGASALPGPAARLVRSAGNNQSVVAGLAPAQPLTVGVLDQYDNGVPGVSVLWAVQAGGGSVSPISSPTDASGLATATYTTSALIGAQSVTATVAGLAGSPVSFVVIATAAITLVASVPVAPNYGIHDTFVRDGLAFVCAWNSGLLIYDVGNGIKGGSPANPQLVSQIVTTGGEVHNAWWYWAPGGAKRYVFIGQEGPGIIGAASSGDIHVVDVSNLLAPVEVASFRLAGAGTHNFWVDEQAEVLYAAYYNGGVVALDISGTLTGNLATREIARLEPGGPGSTYVWGVQLFNGSIYATDMLSGFWQLRLTGNAFSVAGGGNNVPERYGSDQWVAGGYAYSGTWGSRLRAGNALKIWKLGATGAPVLQDSIITAGIGTVSDVEVSPDGKLLMFSAENGPNAGFHFYNITDPAAPVLAGSYLVSSGVHTATFATINGRLYAFGAKDPVAPALIILDVTGLAP